LVNNSDSLLMADWVCFFSFFTTLPNFLNLHELFIFAGNIIRLQFCICIISIILWLHLLKYFPISLLRGWILVFNSTFNNISVISWQSVLLVEETGGPGQNHWPATSHWQTLSHNVVSSTPHWHHEWDSNLQLPGKW
jgi:hypothetical protein